MAKSKGELSDLVQQLTKKGHLKKALAAMEELYAMDKKDPLVTLRMGDLCLKMGDKDGAATNYIRTAGLFAEKGHTPKAVATYRMVLRVDPSLTGVQDKIDALTGAADRPRPAFDKKNVRVDLAKEIPGLEEAAMEMPEPAPIKEPDNTPTYEIDTPIPIGAGRLKQFEPKRPAPPAEPTIELSDAPASFEISEGSGPFEFDSGRADQAAGSIDISSPAGGFELETGLSDDPFFPEGGGIDLGAADDSSGSTPSYSLDDISEPGTYQAAVTDMGDVTGEQALDALEALEVLDGMLEEHNAEEAETRDVRQGIALFSDFSQDELWDLFGKMKRHSFKKDEKVVREGEPGSSIYIIKSGTVRVVTRAGNAELFLATLGEREFFGEVSFLTGNPRSADVIANGPVEIMELKREDLDEQINKHPNLKKVLKSFHEARVADTLATLKAMPRDLMQ